MSLAAQDNKQLQLPARYFWASAVCFLLSGVAVYALHYGTPATSDTLIAEDLYRDLVIGDGQWKHWSLAGAAMYVEIIIYYIIRFVAGNVHAALACNTAVMTNLFALAVSYAAWPALTTRQARILCLFIAPAMGLGCAQGIFVHSLSNTLAHALTLISAVFCAGVYFRWLHRGTAQPAKFLGLLAIVTLLMSASDALFIVWFCIPCLCMTLWLAWRKDISVKSGLTLAAVLLISIGLGANLNELLRYNPHPFDSFSFGFMRFIKNILLVLQATASYFSSATLPALLLLTGIAGTVWAYFRSGTPHTVALYMIAAMVCTLLGITANGYAAERYLLPWYMYPCSLGVLLALSACCERWNTLMRPVAVLVPICIMAWLGGEAWTASRHMKPPYYPTLVRELDELARTRGVRAGVADYWDARLVNMLSQENVVLNAVEARGHYFLLYSHNKTYVHDKVDMFIDNPSSDVFFKLNRELEIRRNGPPDEIIRLSDGIEALIYHNKASHPTQAELIMQGQQLVPDMAAGDVIHFSGLLPLNNGLTLTEVRSTPRSGYHWLVLSFAEPLEDIQGENFVVRAAGNKTIKARAKIADKVSATADSWIDSVLLFFVPNRKMTISDHNSSKYTGRGSIAWAKLPSWNSTEWFHIFLDDGTRVHRIK